MSTVTYIHGADLPDLTVTWRDSDGDVINFSSGYTFSALVGKVGEAAEFAKSTGFTGAATVPNLTVAWAATGELNDLDPKQTYRVVITARRTADGKERKMTAALHIADTVGAVAP